MARLLIQVRRVIPALCALLLLKTLAAQDIGPRIGIIDFYGVHHVSTKKLHSALGIQKGDALPASKGKMEERLTSVSGVVDARIEATCCEEDKLVLYVGIQEKGAPHFEFRSAPDGNFTLPPQIIDTYQTFLNAVTASTRRGQTAEDLTNGYSLMADPGCREQQTRFIKLSSDYWNELHQVVRNARDEEQRAIAAYVLQYGPRSERQITQVVNDLQYALQDPNDTVRNNALRSLLAMSVGAKLHKEQGVLIQPTWLIEMLNSIVWSDRRHATNILMNLTDDRDPKTLALIRERALDSVIEMARWQKLDHALPAFILAGRLAGIPEPEIHNAWTNGDRESVLEKALKPEKSS